MKFLHILRKILILCIAASLPRFIELKAQRLSERGFSLLEAKATENKKEADGESSAAGRQLEEQDNNCAAWSSRCDECVKQPNCAYCILKPQYWDGLLLEKSEMQLFC